MFFSAATRFYHWTAAFVACNPSITHLTRPALHRCLQRHGISRQLEILGDKAKCQKFKRYSIDFFHIDSAKVQTTRQPALNVLS